MAKLIYSAITSLDGYIADEDGNFDWAALREDLAGGRQGRVLQDAGGGIQRQDADRARLRP